jgi:hypothetical protein
MLFCSMKSKNEELYLGHIELWAASGLSKKSYCELNKLHSALFYYYLRKKKNAEKGTNGFVKIQLPAQINSSIKYTRIDGSFFEFGVGTKVELIKELCK